MTGRRVVAGGVAGPTETKVVARVCCWCDVPHWMSATDVRAAAQGARISHGMCPTAEARVNAEIDAMEMQ